MSNEGFIILRDIPRSSVRLDLTLHEPGLEFRGFQQVPPGLHYVGLPSAEGLAEAGFWCYLLPRGTIVKAFDRLQQTFIDNNPDVIDHFAELARSATATQSLLDYNKASHPLWQRLTDHIVPEDFPLTLMTLPTMPHNTRLSAAARQFDGDLRAMMASFQFAFVTFLLKPNDEAAMTVWADLVQASYHANPALIDDMHLWFSSLADTLEAQFRTLPNSMFKPNSVAVYGIAPLLDHMRASTNPTLNEKAHSLARYLAKRGVGTQADDAQ